jgi:4-hydroxy-3-polyprenylbenzoate decarboxylase
MPTMTISKDLHDFVAALESAGQLVRISCEVDPMLEISEIAQRMMKADCPEGPAGTPATDPVNGRFGGKALLFENVRGSDMPVLANAFGSYRRMEMALGCESLEQLAKRVNDLVRPEVPQGLFAKLKKLPELARLAGLRPKVTRRAAPCQEVVHTDGADLTALPVIQCWPGDGQGHPAGEPAKRYITLGAVVTQRPDGSGRNVGMYRVQLLGPKTAAMHIHPPHDGAANWRAWREAGRDMPAAVVLGGEPSLPYAASAPCPPALDELMLAGFLQGGAIELAPCKTIDLAVPARAEIVIEGLVSVTDKTLEGPFGDHTGFYSLADEFPVFRITAITHRRQPIYPTTVVGPPPMEDYYMGKATERIFLPLLQTLVPEIVDYDLPMFGAFHNFVFVKIRKEFPDQARKVMHAIWGAGQMVLSKFIVVVDEDVDVHDPNAVWFHVGANADPARDVEHGSGPADILDHASVRPASGGKLGIDATRKLPEERRPGPWPDLLAMDPATRERVTERWKEYGIEEGIG